MNRTAISLVLLALLFGTAGSQVVFPVFPDPAPLEQPVLLTITNGMRSSINLPNTAPWAIYDSNANLVFAPIALQVIVPVAPLASKQWTWDQKDLNRQQVKAGSYEARISYWLGSNLLVLRTKFLVERVTLQVSGRPTPGGRVQLDMHAPTSTGNPYQLACALGNAPGIPLSVNRLLRLNPDPLFFLSILSPRPVFDGFTGTLGPSGLGTGYVNIPAVPALVGVDIYAAFVTFVSTAPAGIDVHSAAQRISIQ